MLLSRYFFQDEFTKYETMFEKYSHVKKKVKAKEFIITPDGKLDYIYYIKSGIVQVSAFHISGEEKIFGYWSSGSMYPVMCTHQNFAFEHSIAMKAMTETELYVFTVEIFREMLAEDTTFACECIDHHCRYSNMLIFSITTNSCEPLINRVCNILYIQLYHIPNNEDCVELGQEAIASLAGASRVSVARILGTLREKGIIQTAKEKIFILDRERLKKYVSDYCIDKD